MVVNSILGYIFATNWRSDRIGAWIKLFLVEHGKILGNGCSTANGVMFGGL